MPDVIIERILDFTQHCHMCNTYQITNYVNCDVCSRNVCVNCFNLSPKNYIKYPHMNISLSCCIKCHRKIETQYKLLP